MRTVTALALAALLIAAAPCADAAGLVRAERPVLSVWRADGPITIDGALETAWRPTMLHTLALCDDGSAPKALTRVYVARDNDALYVAWHCTEPETGKLVIAGAARDDKVWTGDCVELFVAPEPSGRTYRHFILNPKGVRFDELCEDFGRTKAAAWDAQWEGAAQTGEGAWTAEMRIPFDSLGFAPKEGMLFALQACRQRTPLKEWQASAATFGGFHAPQHFALARVAAAQRPLVVGTPSLRVEDGKVVASSVLSALGPVGEPLSLRATLQADGGRRTVAAQPVEPARLTFREFVLQPVEDAASASLLIEVRSAERVLDAAAVSFKPPRKPLVRKPFGALLARMSSCAVWTASATRKVQLDQPLPSTVTDAVHIAAARNDTEAFQLVLTPTTDIEDVELALFFTGVHPRAGTARPKTGEQLKTLLKDFDGSIRRVGYVPVTRPTDRRGREGLWPDPLLPVDGPMRIEPGRHHPFWVSLYVPEGAVAGTYELELKVTAGGKTFVTVPIRLRVFDFVLPEEPAVRTAYGLNYGSVCQWQGIESDADKRKVADLYLDNFMRHRVSPYDPLWPARYEVAIDGKQIEIDFAAFDAAAKRTLDARHFTGFNYGWGATSVPATLGGHERFSPEYNRLHQLVHNGVCAHLARHGWLDKAYVYWLDEPTEEQYDHVVKGMKLLRAAHPDLQRLLTEQPEEPLYGHVDIWVPVLSQYDRTQDLCKERQELGEEVWWYVCCGPKAPYPNNFTDHPAITHRIRFWMLWKHGVDGSLYWSTTYWRTNPWEDAASIPPNGGFWGNGDGYLLFPPVREKSAEPVVSGPIDTIRWELIREGLEDVEWLYELGYRLDGASRWRIGAHAQARRALRAARRLVPSFTDYEMDPDRLYAVRQRIGEAIERLGEPAD